MIQTLQTRRSPRLLAWTLAALLSSPVLVGLTGCGTKEANSSQTAGSTAPATPSASVPSTPAPSSMSSPATAPAKTGMSTRNKVIILAGAALLYYLYSKHQADKRAQSTAQGNSAQPQLYRSSNGGVYYRDPQNPQQVTWLTVPSQPMQVPAEDIQRYAPDYQQYQGQTAPAVPTGQPHQPFTQYDPSLAGS